MEKEIDDKNVNNNQESVNKQATTESRKELKQLLLHWVEEKIEERRFSDKHFDREKAKVKLLGAEIAIDEVDAFIQSKARVYAPMFKLESGFWGEMCRLLGLPESEASNYFKDRKAAIFINEVIYGTFKKGVLLSFHVLNPYTSYIKRHYKHFQFLTDEGLEKLADVINEAIATMKECSSYYEFRKAWFNKYDVPYQLDAFEEARDK